MKKYLTWLAIAAFSLLWIGASAQVNQVPSNYSHSQRVSSITGNNVETFSGGAVHMGKNRWVAASYTGLVTWTNIVYDSTMRQKFYFSNLPVSADTQAMVVLSNRDIWYALEASNNVRFTRLTEQGTVISQFRLNGYRLIGLHADTLGKVFCFLKDASGIAMVRFSSNGTADFGTHVNGVPGTSPNPMRVGADGKFYIAMAGGILAIDRNGNVGRYTNGPTGWVEGPVYPNGDRSLFRIVPGLKIQVARLDSFMVPRWAREFTASHNTAFDSLISNLDAMIVPATEEIFFAATLWNQDYFDYVTCASVSEGINVRTITVRPDGSLGRVKLHFPFFGKGHFITSMQMSPYGEPIAGALDFTCNFGSLGPPLQRVFQFETIDSSLECGNTRVHLLNNHAITAPTGGVSNTSYVGTSFSPVVASDALSIPIVQSVITGSSTCYKPCARIATVTPLGFGQVQVLDSINGHNLLQFAFGDGTFGNSADPLHTYPGAGNYTVSLIATNECGSDTATYPVDPCRSATMNTPPSGCVGLTTTFTQTSGFPSGNIEWLLNGVSVATGNTFAFTPTANGSYQVSIVLQESPCHDTLSQTFLVNGSAPVPSFTFNAGSNNTVYFTNTSTNATSYLWDFGDGQTSTQASPSHVYAASGTFTICLTATNNCGSVQACSTWTCTFPVAGYTYSLSGPTITLQSTATGATSVLWNFGDGGTATGNSVSHTFAASGTYNVCQFASSACATDTLCTSVATITSGNVFWRRGYAGLGVTTPRGSATNSNGQTVIVGAGSSQEFILIVDSTGAELASLTLPTATYTLYDACTTATGNFIVVGGTTASGPAQQNGFCMELSPAGSILNQRVIGGTNAEYYREVNPARHGGYFLTGVSNSGGYYTKLDANLALQWSYATTNPAFAGFQAADSTYWLVQGNSGLHQFIHLNKSTGLPYEGWSIPLGYPFSGGPSDLSAVMSCGGEIYVIAPLQEANPMNLPSFDAALCSFSTTTHTGLSKTYFRTQTGSYPPTHDWRAMDLAFRPNGNLIAVGDLHPINNPNASPLREQWVADIVPSTLAITTYAAGTNTSQDRLAAISVMPSGAFLSVGDVDGALEMRKFLTSAECRVNSFANYSILPNYSGSTYTTMTPSAPVAYGTLSTGIASPLPLAGQGTLACHTACSTLVNAAFTVTQSGNTVTLTSTSTPGATLSWSVPGQSCLSGSPVSFTLANCSTPAFQVTLTASNGCDMDTETQTVTPAGGPSNPLYLNTLIRDTVRCNTAPVTLTAPGGYSSYLWSNGATTQSTSITATGQVTIRVQAVGGCYYTDTAMVTQGSVTTPNLGANFSHCPGTTATLNAGSGYASYLWSSGATTQTLSVPGAGTFSVTVTSATGCTAADTITVGLHPQPNANLGPDRTICPGTTTNLNPGGGFTTYNWSTGAFSTSINVTNPGIYRVTVTNANGCADADTIVVSHWTVTAMNAGAAQSVCSGTSATFNATPGFTSYLWSNGATTSSITVTSPGTYSVTGTDSHGCTSTGITTLSLLPAPTANLGPDQSICPGSNATLSPGPGFSAYAWSTSATTAAIIVSSPGTYRVTVTNASGCTDADTIVVTQYTVSALSAGSSQTVCPGVAATFAATPGFSAYLWSNGGTASSITVSTPGTYAVTATDANGCTATSSVTLSNFSVAQLSIGPSQAICPGDTATFTATPGFSSYLWSNGATTAALQATTPGTYSVTATDANGCTASAAASLSMHIPPTVNLGPDLTITQGNSATLNGGLGFAGYLWSTGATTSSISVTTAGIYWVQVTDANGCTASDTIEVSVINATEPGIAYELTVRPVPANEVLHVRMLLPGPECLKLELTDLLGRSVLRRNLDCQQEHELEIDLREIASGAYLLRVSGEHGAAVRRVEVTH